MDVRLPKLGENADGGAVVSILVKEGDTIAKGQTILELESEKAVAPIPSTATGIVTKLRVKEGERLVAGQVILEVADAAGAASAPAPASPKQPKPVSAVPAPAPSVSPAETNIPDEGDAPPIVADGPIPPASPEIRRIARELELDLRLVRASGPGGRIEWADLRAYLKRLQRQAAQPRAAAASAGAGGATAAAAAPAGAPGSAVEPIDFARWGSISRQPLSILRKTIGRRMLESWHAVPRVTQFDEVDITELMELRKKFAGAYEQKGARLTLTSFALRAVALSLKKHPVFNSSLDPIANELVLKDYVHIGLAVDTDHGLMVPVLRDADKKSLFALSKDVQEAAEKARDRKLSVDDMKGGTFTISNQGGIGGGHFTPIVNVPEVAILGLGRGALKPAVHNGQIAPRLLLPIAVSYDHRVIDGGAAARFTVDLITAFRAFTESDLAL